MAKIQIYKFKILEFEKRLIDSQIDSEDSIFDWIDSNPYIPSEFPKFAPFDVIIQMLFDRLLIPVPIPHW